MTFFQVPFKISERSNFQLDIAKKPSDKELEEIINILLDSLPTSLTKAYEFRDKYISFVKQGGNRTEMVKAFLKIVFAISPKHKELGLTLMHDCLNWYPGQHWVMSRYTMFLSQIEQTHLAGDNYWRLLRKYPENPHAYTQLGNFLLKHGYYNLALIIVRTAVRNFSEDSIILNCLADVYLKSGHFEQAIICYKDSVARFPNNPINITGLADAYLKGGLNAESIETYYKAMELYPNDPVIMSGLADAYLKSGKIEESIKAYKKMIANFPKVIISKAGLADAYAKNRQYQESITTYLEALEISPNNNVCLNGLGNVYMIIQEYSKAIEIFQRAVETYPRGPLGINGLAVAHLCKGDIKKSLDIYKQYLDDFPENHFFYEGFVEANLVDQNFVEAKRIIEDGLIKFSRNTKLLLSFGEVKLLLREFDDAHSLIKDGISQYADNYRFYLSLIFYHLYQGEISQASNNIEKLVIEYADNEEILYVKDKLKTTFNEKNYKSDKEKFFADLDSLISRDLLLIRNNIDRNRDVSQQYRKSNTKKYAYYMVSLGDELKRMQNNGFMMANPVLLTQIYLTDQSEMVATKDDLEQFSVFSQLFANEYDYKLINLVSKIISDNPDADFGLEEVDSLLNEYGNKWELMIIKNIYEAQTKKTVNELNWRSMFRSHFQNGDFNEYLYSYTHKLSGNADRAKELLANLRRKIQGNAARQKTLWLFGHSKASFKNQSSYIEDSNNYDMLRIKQILISEFYPEINKLPLKEVTED